MILIRSLDDNLTKKYPDLEGCALSIGNFESIHLGHLNLLKSLEIGSQKETKKVLISFEPSPNAYFLQTKQRIYGVKQKISLLKAHLDFLVLLRFNKKLANLNAEDFLNQIHNSLKLSHISIGDDFCFGKNRLGNSEMIQQFCLQNGINYYQLHTVSGKQTNIRATNKSEKRYSTSLVRKNLKQFQFKKVSQILNRKYTLIGKVRKGMALARQIGFPTANIRLNFEPVFSGVFSVKVNLLNQNQFNLNGIANLGRKPTIKGEHQKYFTLEIHLLDDNIDNLEDLNQKIMEVEFIDYVRGEQKFADLNELKNQISKDILVAKKQLNLS